MKHLKSFENFEITDEAIDLGNIGANVSNFFTGHKGATEREAAKEKILADIEEKIQKLVDNGWFTEEQAEKRKDSLIKQAKQNNWKGSINVRKSLASNKPFVVYDGGTSGLQSLGASAAGSVKGNL